MNFKLSLHIVQIILSLLLIGVILLQATGTGLGSAWGGGETYSSKRGAEKFLFTITVILAILFGVASIVNVIVAP